VASYRKIKAVKFNLKNLIYCFGITVKVGVIFLEICYFFVSFYFPDQKLELNGSFMFTPNCSKSVKTEEQVSNNCLWELTKN
jgi:hypothetical protein